MAKLTRYLQKIFANNSNQVGVFGTGTDKETSKNVETLQSADYEEGWSSAIITNKNYPIWQEMDGVQYGLSYQLKYLFQNGIPEWLSTETYYTNSYCRVGSTIYYSLQDNNTNHNPALDDGWWTPLLTSNRSIGEIIPSCIPLTEAGLHLLDGALITNGMYADFVTYMANLTATAPDCFCTEAEWQQSVTTYGVCGKFVYDSVNNTVRLPKVSGKLDGTTDINALGDLEPLFVRLPNITGTFGPSANLDGGYYSTGAFTHTTSSARDDYGANGSRADFTFDASRSSSVYSGDGSNTAIHEQAINVFYYIVIATSTKTDIQVDIDEVVTDLNGKADTDLTNVTDTGYIKMAGASMPSNTYDDLTVGASASIYTAPANGWFTYSTTTTSTQNNFTYLNNETAKLTSYSMAVAGVVANGFIPVKKGDLVSLGYFNSVIAVFRFIYAQGSESEAS